MLAVCFPLWNAPERSVKTATLGRQRRELDRPRRIQHHEPATKEGNHGSTRFTQIRRCRSADCFGRFFTRVSVSAKKSPSWAGQEPMRGQRQVTLTRPLLWTKNGLLQ